MGSLDTATMSKMSHPTKRLYNPTHSTPCKLSQYSLLAYIPPGLFYPSPLPLPYRQERTIKSPVPQKRRLLRTWSLQQELLYLITTEPSFPTPSLCMIKETEESFDLSLAFLSLPYPLPSLSSP